MDAISRYVSVDEDTEVAADLDPVNGSPLWVVDVDSLIFLSPQTAIPTSAASVKAVAECNGTTYQYRIRAIANDVESFSPVRYYDPCGPDPKSGVVAEAEVGASPLAPTEFGVEIYPTPFESTVTARVGLPVDAQVNIVIFDVGGREVYRELKSLARGFSQVSLSLDHLAKGVYIYSVRSVSDVRHGKLVKLK